ncbi:sulfotransferase [Tateyamaria sp. Alg231-49]|uniref:sulfotransferase family protein n=1 Tax=Tateyamaria sp. Alg231-49 TaxID=1922219 RepID=UPI000D54E169|nr:sulfotransferase [Tateyamaria sp. Alg231-49]
MKRSAKPNVFLIGAPKCGTTTVVRALETHSRIFLPYPKETGFWSHDLVSKSDVTNLTSIDDYLALFAKAPNSKTHLLDGSVIHMFSEVAVAEILKFNPNARFLVMLRNPVDQVQSLHQEQRFAMNEDEPDFWTAWQLQDARARGEHVPKQCPDPVRLSYARQDMLGDQLERAMSQIPKDQLWVGFVEDLQRNTEAVYAEILAFLGLEFEPLVDHGPSKSSRTHRFPGLANFYQSPPAAFAPLVRPVKHLLRSGGATQKLVRRLLIKDMKRDVLSSERRAELHALFDPQTAKIEMLTGRDLSSWKAAPTAEA